MNETVPLSETTLTIGTLTLPSNLLLAPMAGITDQPFRILCREQGCGLAYTEMVSAKGLYYNSQKTKYLLQVADEERPIGAQLFGAEPDVLAEMAKRIENDGDNNGIALIDINMGCPAPKIVKNGEGSALLKNPALIGKIVSAVSKAVTLPVTVKVRKGFDEASVNAVEVAKICAESGAAAITVHGRTRTQFYEGRADWDIIRAVKQAVRIPVIGNGDVSTPQLAEKMLQETGCDGVMVARAAEGNPWLFYEINTYLRTGMLPPPPGIDEKKKTALRHGRMLLACKGEYVGTQEFRKHLAWYTKGAQGSAVLRAAIHKAASFADMEALIRDAWV